MSTHRSTWKRAEASVAAIFGARRRVLSGSANRSDIDGDDTTHPRLWIEVKLREHHAVWSLWRDVNAASKKAIKTPVLGLREKSARGALLVVHENHMAMVVTEWLAAQTDQSLLEIEAAVRQRRSEDSQED